MTTRRVTRGGAVAAALAAGASLLAGIAYAHWSGATGDGSGSFPGGSSAPITLAAGTTTSTLFPGGTADVAVSIGNGNPHEVFVGSLSADTGQGTNGFAVDGGHSGCNLGALSFTTQSNGGAGWSVAASSTSDLDLAGAVSLSPAAASACQGAQVTVYLQASP